MWALGVITYNLIAGCYPFEGNNMNNLFKAIMLGKFSLEGGPWDDISEDAKDFIRKLL